MSYTVEAVVERVHEAVGEAGLEAPVIVGHSAAAGTAFLYGVMHPCRGVVAVEGTLRVGAFAGMAQAMGIPVPSLYIAVFAIGAGMAAASGVLFGPLAGVTQNIGADFTLRAFIVVVVGGMGNLGGSILASIFISLLEAYASLIVSPAQAVIVSFVALILTLLLRPTGLFVPTPK
jgi:branched-chain amino acid transport system permease protein